jgi:hypothetical protein
MGAGYYVCAWVTSNSGVTPTVRYINRTAPAGSFTGQDVFGYTLNAAGTQLVPVYRAGSNTITNCVLTSILSSYTASDITSSFANLNPPVWGFGLNTVR